TFTSRDTATLNPDPSVQANRYTYANASPLTHTDPTGHASIVINNPIPSPPPKGDPSATPYYSWPDQPGGLYPQFNEGEEMWWEERYGDYALRPQITDEEAKKWGIMPTGRPMPKDMEEEFWSASEGARKEFLVLYNVMQMYNTEVTDNFIVVQWMRLNPPTNSPMAASTPAPGAIDQWESCAMKISKKKCDAWRKAAETVVAADYFSKNCLTSGQLETTYETCAKLLPKLGITTEYWSNKIVDKFKSTALFKVLDIFVGDAVACRDGDIASCILMASDLAGGAAVKGVKALGAVASRVGSILGAATATCRRGGCDWAKISGILRDASKGKGNFGLGTGTIAEANQAGASWVGDGYKVVHKKNGDTLWISADGRRQYRLPSYKPNWGNYQANFEWRPGTSGQWQGNGHLHIKE
ncbi:hypothetical protein ACSDR0_45795, partial [Streptosporangium sp. G11]|uniref:hypothetical protein n=1 Tax=Streptosporangium sp. G11 TaxID=3436926 RepID=UPI003EC00BB2